MFLNKIILVISILALSGCASFDFGFGKPTEKPIIIATKAVEKTPLALADPAPLRLKVPKWKVVTPQNVDAIWKDLQDKKVDLVLFALTDDGYEELSVDMAEIRNLIATQRSIILKYKEYYETSQPSQQKEAISNK
jgi:hypothetical protein